MEGGRKKQGFHQVCGLTSTQQPWGNNATGIRERLQERGSSLKALKGESQEVEPDLPP